MTPAPSSRFWIIAHARSDGDLLKAEFVRRGGRPGHEGLFAISRSPIAGRPATLRIALAEPNERIPVFELFSAHGRSIQRVALARLGDNEFIGEIALPLVPFRVGVSGTDADGGRYQRLTGRMFRGETVEVVPPALDEVVAGADAPIVVALRNHGGPARYRVTARVRGEALARIEPAVVDLPANGEQQVTVWVPAATVAAAGTSLDLFVFVASDPDQSSSNRAHLQLTVVKR